MIGVWLRAGLVFTALIAAAPARPTFVAGQEVVPGGDRTLTTPDLAPEHWAMDALRRAEALGLLDRPLPFRRAVSVDVAAAALARAAASGERRGPALQALTAGWRERFEREFGGVAGLGAVESFRWVGMRAGLGAAGGWGRVAPGSGEVGEMRTGAVPLSDTEVAGLEAAFVAAVGGRVGLLTEPELSSDGIRLRRAEVVMGVGNLRLSAGRQPVALARSPQVGLAVSGAVTLDRVAVGTRTPARLGGPLRFVGPVGGQLFVTRLWDDPRHLREPYLWGGTFSLQPHPRIGLAVHRATMLGGRGWDEPVTLKTFIDMFIGRIANLGFENQIVSVEGRYRLPSEEVLPLSVFFEWGAEDAAGGWWDVPGRVVGLETPAIPGLEPLSAGVAYARIDAQCCGNSPWYRHGAFPGNWAVGELPLGHPLGGEGREWQLFGSYDRPDANHRMAARVFRRVRTGQNLFVPGRPSTIGGELHAAYFGRGWEIDASYRTETGSGRDDRAVEVGANVFF